jgi:hypothetical protein
MRLLPLLRVVSQAAENDRPDVVPLEANNLPVVFLVFLSAFRLRISSLAWLQTR